MDRRQIKAGLILAGWLGFAGGAFGAEAGIADPRNQQKPRVAATPGQPVHATPAVQVKTPAPVGPAIHGAEPGIQALWMDGHEGTWFGRQLSVVMKNVSAVGNIACHDGVGDDVALQVDHQGQKPGFWLGLASAAPADATAYFNNGHIQFDLRLEQACVSNLVVAYGALADFGKGRNAYVRIPAAGLNTATFTRISVPLRSFTRDECGSVDLPFVLYGVACGPGPVVAVGHVQWTDH
jgi:hypothetical protein